MSFPISFPGSSISHASLVNREPRGFAFMEFVDPYDAAEAQYYMNNQRGEKNVMNCRVQYLILWGTMVGYTVTAAMSMMAIKRSDCFHAKGLDAPCEASGTLYVIIFGVLEVILSQFSNLAKNLFLSYTAAAMSFAYSSIGLCLCMVQLVLHYEVKENLLGVNIDSTSPLKLVLLAISLPCTNRTRNKPKSHTHSSYIFASEHKKTPRGCCKTEVTRKCKAHHELPTQCRILTQMLLLPSPSNSFKSLASQVTQLTVVREF